RRGQRARKLGRDQTGIDPLKEKEHGLSDQTDLAESEKRTPFPSQSVGLPPRAGARGGRRLALHSTRPGLPQGSAVRLAMRGRGCSVLAFEGSQQLRLCGAVRWSGSRGYAAPDRLESQAWTINPPAAARVPYTT